MVIQHDKSLRSFNSFGIDASAKFFVEIKSAEEFRELISDQNFKKEKKLILGGGSNILFTKDFNGLVIKNAIPGIEVTKEDSYYHWVKAGAGEPWHPFVIFCVNKNFSGIENLSLIPGLVGAAPMQNIGAYGVEIKETCEEVEAIHIDTGVLQVFKNADCEFGYRESIFKNKYRDQFLISAVTFKLNKIFKPKIAYGDISRMLAEMRVDEITIKAVSEAVIKIRSAKLPDPAKIGNAGSFFKNPVVNKKQFEALVAKYPLMPNYIQNKGIKIPAAWLIEQCGWKGKAVGNAGVHMQQALVLVNYGGATGDEIMALAIQIKNSVKEKFGIEISSEVNLV
ncbi:MAG: UDP-N-acetylmuramate dehydrogenase [Chitinophagales bacterium]|nr:UDP-N-acetylmuramate dehydrogenase [Chitinophagales bacterium]